MNKIEVSVKTSSGWAVVRSFYLDYYRNFEKMEAKAMGYIDRKGLTSARIVRVEGAVRKLIFLRESRGSYSCLTTNCGKFEIKSEKFQGV